MTANELIKTLQKFCTDRGYSSVGNMYIECDFGKGKCSVVITLVGTRTLNIERCGDDWVYCNRPQEDR